MKKVLFVITKSNWGGAQRYVFDLATHLSKEEFEVVVALGGTGEVGSNVGELARRLQDAGVRVIFVRSFMRNINIMNDAKVFFELWSIFKKEKPNVIHLNSSKTVLIGALVGRITGASRIIATVHGWAFNEARPTWQKIILKFVQWFSVILSTKTIVVSEHDAEQVKRWLFVGNKIIPIHNGIDLQMQFGSGEKIRNAFPSGVKITGTVGELTRNKNQQALIEQATNNPDMYVDIVGEGDERKNLEERIRACKLETRVKLFGVLPAHEVMKGFDTFALPSLKEGLPYVLLEAKAAGLPIVANRVGGVGEIVDAKEMNQFSLKRMVEETKKLY